MVKQTYFNQQLNDYCLKLTKESINKYTKKILDNNINKNKDTKFLMNIDSDVSNPNSNPNNNPYIIIYCIGLFSFVSIFYFFLNQKSK
jgi:hypothetical protein